MTAVPFTTPDYHAALRYLARQLAVLQVRRDTARFDDLERRVVEAERLLTVDDRLAAFAAIAIDEGFTPEGNAA